MTTINPHDIHMIAENIGSISDILGLLVMGKIVKFALTGK